MLPFEWGLWWVFKLIRETATTFGVKPGHQNTGMTCFPKYGHDKHKELNAFPDSDLVDIGLPLKSFVVVIGWTCLLVFGTYKFLQWSNILSSWKGLTFTAIWLAIVTLLMQILIQFSQEGSSTPAKVAPTRSSIGTVQEKKQ